MTDNEIFFIMNSDRYKQEKWDKASVLQKMRYWVIMDHNQQVLSRQDWNRQENDNDDSSYSRNYEELKSYRSEVPLDSSINMNVYA